MSQYQMKVSVFRQLLHGAGAQHHIVTANNGDRVILQCDVFVFQEGKSTLLHELRIDAGGSAAIVVVPPYSEFSSGSVYTVQCFADCIQFQRLLIPGVGIQKIAAEQHNIRFQLIDFLSQSSGFLFAVRGAEMGIGEKNDATLGSGLSCIRFQMGHQEKMRFYITSPAQKKHRQQNQSHKEKQ